MHILRSLLSTKESQTMTTALDTSSTSTIERTPPLSLDCTLDRSLVHRTSLSEVFLTDLLEQDGTTCLAAAQLPRSHAYWGDHLLSPGSHDPILVLEVCRQAALAASHHSYGVPTNAKFILTHQGLRIDRPDLLRRGPVPAELSIRLTAANRRERAGVTTGLDYTMALRVGDAELGFAEIGLRFKSPADYTDLRLRGRAGVAPGDTGNLRGAPSCGTLTPYLVGRHRPENVILLEPENCGTVSSATLSVPGDHPSLFDHPQDHIPGMVLVEAGRQLALYAAREQLGVAASKTRVRAVDAAYRRFGELETPIRLEATILASREPTGLDWTQAGPLEPDGVEGHRGPEDNRQLKLSVTVFQEGTSICDLAISLDRAA